MDVRKVVFLACVLIVLCAINHGKNNCSKGLYWDGHLDMCNSCYDKENGICNICNNICTATEYECDKHCKALGDAEQWNSLNIFFVISFVVAVIALLLCVICDIRRRLYKYNGPTGNAYSETDKQHKLGKFVDSVSSKLLPNGSKPVSKLLTNTMNEPLINKGHIDSPSGGIHTKSCKSQNDPQCSHKTNTGSSCSLKKSEHILNTTQEDGVTCDIDEEQIVHSSRLNGSQKDQSYCNKNEKHDLPFITYSYTCDKDAESVIKNVDLEENFDKGDVILPTQNVSFKTTGSTSSLSAASSVTSSIVTRDYEADVSSSATSTTTPTSTNTPHLQPKLQPEMTDPEENFRMDSDRFFGENISSDNCDKTESNNGNNSGVENTSSTPSEYDLKETHYRVSSDSGLSVKDRENQFKLLPKSASSSEV